MLRIGEIEIPCAVLEDGTRVFSETGVAEALLGGRSGASIKIRRIAKEEGRAPLPVFLAPGQLKPFISNELLDRALSPISYVVNGKRATGYEATVKKARLHQWLTQEMGHPKLREHLASIVTLMRISKTPDQFKAFVDQAHPRFGETIPFNFIE